MGERRLERSTGLRLKTGAQAITTVQDEMVGRAVTKVNTTDADYSDKDTYKLSGDNDPIHKSIITVQGDYVTLAGPGGFAYFRNGLLSSLQPGDKILGTTRTVGTATEYGYVKSIAVDVGNTSTSDESTTIENLFKAHECGTVVNGGEDHASNTTRPPADILVDWN